MEIKFTYDGRNFTVDKRAYDVGRVVLPDKRVLDIPTWYESLPPIPATVYEVAHSFSGTPEEIALIMNGVVAKES